MTVLDDYTVVVSSETELSEAITGVNTYKYIYFDQDITLTSGIIIPATKSDLTIDGTYNNIRHKFTDVNSATASQTLYINSLNSSVPTMNITMKNVDLIGRNYYGIICVYDSAYAANVTTTYDNVTYVGPQITYNNYGTTQYLDSTITINNTTSSRSGEIGEVHKVVIGGNTTINHTFSGFSGFHFRGGSGASLTVLPNSNVNLTLARNLFAGDVDPDSITFGANSVCNITVPAGLSLSAASRVNNVLIDTGATLNVYRTSSSGSATLYVNNSFTVKDGASLLMKSSVSSTDPHLYFYVTGANLNIDNPASCIFYNPGSANFYFTGTTNINLKSYQINQWNAAPAVGDINNLPTYQWIRKKNGLIEFSGTATNTTTNITSNNLDPVEDVKLPAPSSLQLRTLRVLSLGYLPLLKVNRIINTATSISGTTLPSAGIKTEYEGEISISAADGSGNFNVPVTKEFVIDKEAIVMNSNNNFLYNKVYVVVEEPGELSLYVVPDFMVFDTSTQISRNPCIFGREVHSWTIQVYDSRVYSSNWKLKGEIDHDMICPLGYTLPDSLIYVEGAATSLLSSTPVQVFQGQDNGGVTKITDVKWPENEGILLKIDQTPIYANLTYTTPVTWTLEE